MRIIHRHAQSHTLHSSCIVPNSIVNNDSMQMFIGQLQSAHRRTALYDKMSESVGVGRNESVRNASDQLRTYCSSYTVVCSIFVSCTVQPAARPSQTKINVCFSIEIYVHSNEGNLWFFIVSLNLWLLPTVQVQRHENLFYFFHCDLLLQYIGAQETCAGIRRTHTKQFRLFLFAYLVWKVRVKMAIYKVPWTSSNDNSELNKYDKLTANQCRHRLHPTTRIRML